MDRISLTLEFLNKKFTESAYFAEHPEERRYRYEHTLRVANIGKTIALKEGFDVEGLVIACLLHDISYCEAFNSDADWLNHGRRSAEIACEFVASLNFDKKLEQEILYGIAIHVDDKADFPGEKTPFAECVGDADNIDRFDAYRLYESLKNAKYETLAFEEQLEFCQNRLAKLPKLLEMSFGTKTSTEMFHEKIQYQIEFFQRLKNQLDNSLEIK